MRCPRCNAQVSFQKNRCDNCGQDLKNYRRVLSASNICYNRGLAQAKVRDLSGAVVSLKKSLDFNKMNTNARNLLGLIYFEEGEVVAALSEWVISKHFQEKDNDADRYIEMIQSNPNRLESYSQMVKKYNSALVSAKNGDEDMAIIQLKKVVSMNPKYVKAHQLLALLYMQTGKKENRVRACKLMKAISRVDVTNTTTLAYLKELSDVHIKGEAPAPKPEPARDPGVRKTLPKVDDTAYQPITLYKEEKPSILPFVHVLLGVILGIVVMQFLVTPALKQKSSTKENNEFKTYSENLASGESDVSSLQNANEELQEQVDELTQRLSDLQEGSPTDIDTLQQVYDDLIAAMQFYINGDNLSAAKKLSQVDADSLSGDDAKKFYRKIKKETYATASQSYFEKGRDCYNGEGDYVGKQDYDKAIKLLKKALTFDSDNTDAIYFLGRCYQQKSDTETAKEYYNQIVNDYPDSTRVTEAKSRLREMGE
jgi:tetratricopeptide (TPR) repeat protein